MAASSRPKILYRPSSLQYPVLSMVEEFNLWQEFGLEPDLELQVETEIAERRLIEGDAQLVIGNHITPHADRARGVPIVYLAQATNWAEEWLVAKDNRIKGLTDLRGRSIAAGVVVDDHPTLTTRLRLEKAGLEPEKDEIQFVPVASNPMAQIEAVRDNKVDAAMVMAPYDLKARRWGYSVVTIPKLPMVWGLTVTALSPFALHNGELIKGIIKAIITGIYYFKTRREEALRTLKERLGRKMSLETEEELEYFYDYMLRTLETKLYPTLEAIQNVYRLALFNYPEARKLNPLTMWDLHYMREVDEEGFVDQLYSREGA
jgi:ABC-type nitrate/sulfonate/bicarbonate transport system substrate-binding protein